MQHGEHRCHARVSAGPGAPTQCQRTVEWAQDIPYDAWPQRRRRTYWCDVHVWSVGADPRRLTTEDVAILRWRRAAAVRVREQIETRRRAGQIAGYL